MFEAYGSLAEEIETPILIAGRNLQHIHQLDYTISDICSKLLPESGDRLLEIGCNIGLLLNPISKLVSDAVGLDHSKLIDLYKNKGTPENVTLKEGEWPKKIIDGCFDCILVYDVLHLVPTVEEAVKFIEACYPKLKSGGRLLLGDLPNRDMHKRYQSTDFGKKLAFDYEKERNKERQNRENESQYRTEILADANFESYIDDEFVFSIIQSARREHLHAFVLPQPENLPFCYSREDILIVRPK